MNMVSKTFGAVFSCEPLQAECEGGFFMSFFVTADGGPPVTLAALC